MFFPQEIHAVDIPTCPQFYESLEEETLTMAYLRNQFLELHKVSMIPMGCTRNVFFLARKNLAIVELLNTQTYVYIYMYKDGSWSPLHNTNQLFFSRSLVILNAVPGRMYPRLLKLKKILFLQRFCHVFLPIFWEKFHMPPWHLGFFCHRLPPPRRDWLIVVPRKMPKS